MEWTTVISTLGFPIFVSLYFMFRLERVVKSNTEAINKHTEAIIRLTERLK